ncbi:MAG: ribosomal large subunit pseudouridine synthase C [Alphaproteobacteria bacterium]|nr:MAG: ribosomal large subunit pseudouridine synthase C [Alphaproteobacteria bacterium]
MIEKKSLASLNIKKEDIGIRLDKILLKKFNSLSFIKIQKLIRIGFFKVNNRKVKSNYKVNEADKIQYSNKSINENKFKKDISSILIKYKKQIADIKKNIIFEDNFLLVINKPYGIPVQGGNNVNFNIDLILPILCENNSSIRLVHRIDKNTSGILLLAKTKEVAQNITMLFKENKIKKKYLAIVEGKLTKRIGKITLPVTKKKIAGMEKMVIDPYSKEKAETSYKVIDYKKGLSLLEVYPKTGRKHQIRVHLQSINHPILGDNKYNKTNNDNKEVSSEKMHLHAKEIQFVLNNNKYFFKASLPNFFKETIKKINIENTTYE